MKNAVRVLAIFLLARVVPAFAQSPPNAGSLFRQQEQLEQKVPRRFPEEEPSEVLHPARQDIEGVKVLVESFRFSGAVELVPESELQVLVGEAVGKELDFVGLQRLVDRVTEYLRRKGWLLARAYLPHQDVTEGRVEIAISQGRLDGVAGGGGGWRIELDEGVRIDAGRLAAMAEAAAPSGGGVRQEEVERALLVLNDLPGVHARARMEPGSKTATTRIVANIGQGPLLTGNVWADNFGNDSTGQSQLSSLIRFDDPSGHGDRVKLAATASEGLQLARLEYDFPLGVQGLRASVGSTLLRYEVVEGSGEAAGLQGYSRIFRAGLSYPFVRSLALNLHGTIELAHKAFEDDSDAGPLRARHLDALTVGLQGDKLDSWGGGGLNGWSMGVTAGDLDLSRVPADAAVDAATLQTQGGYGRVDLNLSRLQKLPASFTLLGRISAQWAGWNLDPAEQFFLGGPAGVRGYPLGEAQGDEGWLAGLDLRYELPGTTPWGGLQLFVFADTGRIRLHEDPGSIAVATATGRNSYGLSGAGLGLNLSQVGRHSLLLVWAHTLGGNPGRNVDGGDVDGGNDDSRFWLQTVLWF